MIKYFCDGCGQELQRDEVGRFIEVDLEDDCLSESGDFCPECRIKIKEFMESMRSLKTKGEAEK